MLGVAEQLNEFVGAIPVYGDVNDILEASMFRMKVRPLPILLWSCTTGLNAAFQLVVVGKVYTNTEVSLLWAALFRSHSLYNT